jgi:hypothetical protein
MRSSQDLEEYLHLIQYDKLPQLLAAMDKVNPPLKKAGRSGEEVLEI